MVHVVNASVTPSVNLTDTTNDSGVLELIGVPTSTQGYADRRDETGLFHATRPIRPARRQIRIPRNPTLTAVAADGHRVTFTIDRLSSITVATSDNRCNADRQ